MPYMAQLRPLAANQPRRAAQPRNVPDFYFLLILISARSAKLPSMIKLILHLAIAAALLAGCGQIWNDPYPASGANDNTLYTSFTERPKHLDPAQSYTEVEAEFLAQIYEPPFQYHYFKRPYQLIPATAADMPTPRYFDKQGNALPDDARTEHIATTRYEFRIKKGGRFQPHPAFVEANRKLSREVIAKKFVFSDFPDAGTREFTAADYVYEIKRLAHPRVNSPIFSHMADYIVGLKEYGDTLKAEAGKADKARGRGAWIDLRKLDISGVKIIDASTFSVTVTGKYPQFLYWMAMTFFAPIPWEADEFYSQPGMTEKNFSFDWWPVGTGPYMLTENNPNARITLVRNPHWLGEAYPSEGEKGDREAGLLADAGKPLPFIDRIEFVREKEQIPYWNKFLQGYFDKSGIASDNFDQAIKSGADGDTSLTPEMEARGIKLKTSLSPSSSYIAFNWLDPIVGGSSEKSRKLRYAMSLAIDWEEFISIFANGRGIPAQGPIPPGIFGFTEGKESINPVNYDWLDGKPKRKSIEVAKKHLADAGYPGGRDAKTGQPLVIYLDAVERSPADKPRFDWYRKQFAKIDVQLEIRGSDFNRFQEKLTKGNTQLFYLGWNADYPDPENFLFLLYGPNGMVKSQGENKSNYADAEFDRLFEQMKNMENGPERQSVVDKMMQILWRDTPWIWAFHPKSYGLSHAWMSNSKPNEMARNGIKYQRIDTAMRAQKRAEWNHPVVWPFVLLVIGFALVVWLGMRAWRRAESAVAVNAALNTAAEKAA